MKIETVFVDLDGVLADWTTGITHALGLSMDIYQPYLADPEQLTWELRGELLGRERMNSIMRDSVDFWANLSKFSWSDRLLSLLASKYEVAFLTSPSNYPAATSGKMLWQQKHYPEIPLILCKHKHIVAAPNKLLIDDDSYQITRYSQRGPVWQFGNQFTLQKFSNEFMMEYINKILVYIGSIK